MLLVLVYPWPSCLLSKLKWGMRLECFHWFNGQIDWQNWILEMLGGTFVDYLIQLLSDFCAKQQVGSNSYGRFNQFILSQKQWSCSTWMTVVVCQILIYQLETETFHIQVSISMMMYIMWKIAKGQDLGWGALTLRIHKTALIMWIKVMKIEKSSPLAICIWAIKSLQLDWVTLGLGWTDASLKQSKELHH